MKKLTLILTILILFFGFAPPSDVSAEIPGGEFESTMRLQNMGTDVANVTYTFYDSSGTDVYHASTTIAVGDVLIVYIPSLSGLANGEYSVVVESSQPLASLSDLNDEDSGAAYTGFDQGSTSWYVPGLYDNYHSFYSSVTAQNTSTSEVDITLEIFAGGNSVPVYSNTKSNVASYASVTWDQKDVSELLVDEPYSGVITATGEVVAIVNLYGSDDGVNPQDVDTTKQLYSYNAYADGDTLWYTPVLMNDYSSWNTAIAIQNVGSSTANVDVNYSSGDFEDYAIPPYSAVTIYIPTEYDLDLPSGPDNGLFSAIITADQDVVVMVNESNQYDRAATYNAFASGTTKVFAPEIMKNNSYFSTSVTCQNIGTSATRMQIEYNGYPAAGSTIGPVDPGEIHLWYQPNEGALPDGYESSAIITSLDGQPIACIMNRNLEHPDYFTVETDMLFSYNGINQ